MLDRAATSGGLMDLLGRRRERAAEEADYRPFPDVDRRNAWQETLEVPALAWALGLREGCRVLEVGCGRGVALPVLARLLRPKRLTGLDINSELEGDLRALPLPDASFDLVVDFGTCYHPRGMRCCGPAGEGRDALAPSASSTSSCRCRSLSSWTCSR